MSKTENDAIEFAKTLRQDDADMFLSMWHDGKFDMIQGHFPAFMGDNTADADAVSKGGDNGN